MKKSLGDDVSQRVLPFGQRDHAQGLVTRWVLNAAPIQVSSCPRRSQAEL